MLKNKTVIVVGAGSSLDVGGDGFPGGPKLKRSVAEALSSLQPQGRTFRSENRSADRAIARTLGEIAQVQGSSSEFIKLVCEGASQIAATSPSQDSIDRAISIVSHAEGTIAAKVAIFHFIMMAELSYRAMRDTDELTEALANTWIGSLLKLMFADCPANRIGVALEQARFVSFNYDRILERLIQLYLRSRYGMDAKEAAGWVGELRIEHPYGSLGGLAAPFDDDGIEFGYHHYVENEFRFANKAPDRIRTFAESVDDATAQRIQSAVFDAPTLLFMGFGFGEENLRLIFPDHFDRTKAGVYCTNFGIADTRWNDLAVALEARLSMSSDGNVQSRLRTQNAGKVLARKGCAELIEHFRERL